jgi:hypothetical protein
MPRLSGDIQLPYKLHWEGARPDLLAAIAAFRTPTREEDLEAARVENFGAFLASPWQVADAEFSTRILSQVTPIYGKYPVVHPPTQVWRSRLKFYDDSVLLVRIRDPRWKHKNLFVYYLLRGSDIYALNGASPPIHELNAKAPVRLNETNVLDYLRFFCFFVRGEEGPFYIVENASDPFLPEDPLVRQIVTGTARPATFEGMDHTGAFLCSAVVYYSNAIFIANFAIEPAGMVRMLDDEPIAADLPAKIDAPIT